MANEKQMNSRIQHKIDTAENWSKATGFTPLKGELIIYSDLKKFKVGDGDTNVNELPFYQAFDSIVEDENGIIHIGGYHDERYVENAGDLEVGSGTIHAGRLYLYGSIGSEAGYELDDMGLRLQAANGGHQHAFELDGIRLNGIHSETGDAHTYFSVTETVEDGEPDEGEDPSENRVFSHQLYLDGDAHFRGNVYVGDDTKRLLTEDDLQGGGFELVSEDTDNNTIYMGNRESLIESLEGGAYLEMGFDGIIQTGDIYLAGSLSGEMGISLDYEGLHFEGSGADITGLQRLVIMKDTPELTIDEEEPYFMLHKVTEKHENTNEEGETEIEKVSTYYLEHEGNAIITGKLTVGEIEGYATKAQVEEKAQVQFITWEDDD